MRKKKKKQKKLKKHKRIKIYKKFRKINKRNFIKKKTKKQVIKKRRFKTRKPILKKRKFKTRKRILKKKKNKKKRINQNLIIEKREESFILKIIRFQEKFKPRFNFKINFSLEKTIKGFFDKISHKIKEYKIVKEKEKRRGRLEELERIEKEHITLQKQRKAEEELRTKLKEKALKDEIKIEKERVKDIKLFLRQEQAFIRNEQAEKSLDWTINKLIYKDEVVKMSEYMDGLLGRIKVVSSTSEKLLDIISWIKKSGRLSKKEILDNLNWGRSIKWTSYRRALMNHSNIYDVNGSVPYYCWKD